MTSLRERLRLMGAIWRGEPVVYRVQLNGTVRFPAKTNVTECVLAGPPPLYPFKLEGEWPRDPYAG